MWRGTFALLFTALSLFTWAQVNERAEELYDEDRFEEAARLFEASARSALVNLDYEDYLFYIRRAAKSLSKGGQVNRSIELLEDALPIAKPHVGYTSEAYERTLNLKAQIHYGNGHLDEGIAAYEESLVLLERLSNEPSKAKAYSFGNCAILYNRKGEYAKGVELLRKEIRILEQLRGKEEDLEMGNAFYNLGSSFNGLGERDSAIKYFWLGANEWYVELGSTHSYLQYSYHSIGENYFQLGEKDSARKYFALEADIRIANNEIPELPASKQTSAADTLTTEGMFQLAIDHYREAMHQRAKELGPGHPATVGCQTSIAQVLMLLGDYQGAVEASQQAMGGLVRGFSSSNVNDNPHEFDSASSSVFLFDAFAAKVEALCGLYDETKSVKHLEAAHKTLMQSVPLIDLIRQQSQAAISKLFFGQKIIPHLEQGIELTHFLYDLSADAKYLKAALVLVEKNKAFLMQEALKDLEVKESGLLRTEWLAEEHRLRNNVAQAENYLLSEQRQCANADPKRIAIWEDEIITAKAELNVHLRRLEREAPEYHKLRHAPVTTNVDEVKGLLEPGEVVLEYFWGDEDVWLLTISTEASGLTKVGPADSLRTRIDSFRSSLANVKLFRTDPDAALGHYVERASGLYNSLLAPSFMEGMKALIIIPDGPIGLVPFEALVDGNATSFKGLRYLLNDYSVTVQNSIETWKLLRERKASTGLAYRGFAPSYPGTEVAMRSGLGKLAFTQQEVSSAKELMGGKIFLGDAATKQRFADVAQQAGVLHLAMHATVSDQEPLLSGLHFTQVDEDNILHINELFNMKLNAQLAILSACNTGYGKVERGEGIMSLARGFFFAGCPSVVMSLWELDDAATAQIVEHMLRGLKEDKLKKDQALRQAKLAYLESADNHTAHPYFWAGLTLIGDAAPLEKKESNRAWLWLIGGAFLLAGALSVRLFRSRPDAAT